MIRTPLAALPAVGLLGMLAACTSPAAPTPTPTTTAEVRVAAVDAVPGTRYGFGELVSLPLSVGSTEVAVMALTTGADWTDLVANPDDFSGLEPTLVELQVDGVLPYLIPVTADGTTAQLVLDAGGAPVSCAGTGAPADSCLVVASDAASGPVTAIEWRGIDADTPFQPTPEETPFYADPIRWG